MHKKVLESRWYWSFFPPYVLERMNIKKWQLSIKTNDVGDQTHFF